MKLSLNRSTFEKIIGRSTGFIDEHSVSGIFDNFLIEAVNQTQIAITATDANAHTGIISIMQVENMEQPESFLINAKRVDSIVRSLDSDIVDLEFDSKGNLSIKGGRSHFKVPVSSITEYVNRPIITGAPFELEISKLLFLIKKSWFAISNDTSKQKMRAGYLKYENGKIVMVGTDAFQLAYSEIEEEGELPDILKNGILIAKDDLARLRKILETEEPTNKVKIIIQDNSISFKTSNKEEHITTTVWLRLLGTDYVSYQTIFREPKYQVIGNRKELQKILKRATITTSKESPVLKFDISPNLISIESSDEYSYRFSESLDVAYSGDDMVLGISSKFLNDMIAMLDSESFVLDIKSEDSVIMIYAHKESDRVEDRKYFYVLMPMDIV